MLEYWSKFLSSGTSESSVRLAFLAWGLGVLVIWGYVSIVDVEVATIPDSVIYVLATLMTGKYLSKKVEVSKEIDKICSEKEDKTNKKEG